MTTAELNADTVLVRALDVTTRITDEVAGVVDGVEGGVLLERLIGRWVLDADGRRVWGLLDGQRTIANIAEAIAATAGAVVADVAPGVQELCAALVAAELVAVAPAAA